MTMLPQHDPAYRNDLGDGLLVRWSTSADTEAVAELVARVFRHKPDAPPNEGTAAWARDLMSGRHPLIEPGDWALVEDVRTQRPVACTCLMAQTWEYSGIPFAVGRPELVATDVAYRRRGLIRAIFELIHARSAARGDLALGITGIPYYYRLFGYEYAIELEGSHNILFTDIPPLTADQREPYTLRSANPDDVPLLLRLYDRERRGPSNQREYLVVTQLDERYWRFLITGGLSEASHEGWRTDLIVNTAGDVVGYVLTYRKPHWSNRRSIPICGFVLEPGIPYPVVLPSVLRALQAQAPAFHFKADDPSMTGILLLFNRQHPVYDALGESARVYRRPYAWYVRVPHLPAFIRHVASVLERRLADSMMAGYSGELKLDFYRNGLRVEFENGRIRNVEDWSAPLWDESDRAHFPPTVFLQLLFGHRRLSELQYAYMDVMADHEPAVLLNILFPAQPSSVLPLE